MAKWDTQNSIDPSLLDRLIDREPRISREPVAALRQSLPELKASLRRDLEWLLNSRRTPQEAPADARELQRSLYNFGLPDLTSLSLKSAEDQRRLVRMLEAAIATFEPRLQGVTVVMQPFTPTSRVLRFQIEALLRVEPSPERVFFDTTLELSSGQYAVEGESRAR